MAGSGRLDLVGGANPSEQVMAPKTGMLITNHMNIMFMLSAGLIMPPSGFGDKYYKDTLGDFPGWIPVFIKKASRQAIQDSTTEERFLKPCIVEVGLSGLSGRAFASGSAELEEIRFPEGYKDTHKVLLFPGPLPVSRIESIIFRSVFEKNAVESDAKDYDNVPLTSFKRKTGKRLFATSASNTPWPAPNGPENLSLPLHVPFAAGGVMAMLMQFGNLGEQAVQACRIAFDPDDTPQSTGFRGPFLSGLRSWIFNEKITLAASINQVVDPSERHDVVQAKLYWGIVEELAGLCEIPQTDIAGQTITKYLSGACSDVDSELHEHVTKLIETLTSMTGFPEFTPGELFDRHPATLDRALILFFLCENSDDLLGYDNDRLTERDWLAAAILFGVRDGWIKLPTRLRSGRDFIDSVSHRMARLSHQLADTRFELGETPPRIRPLRELFGEDSDWLPKKQKAALALARNEKWNCIRTRVALRTGEYKLTVKGGSVQIELSGEPRVTPEINRIDFLNMLADSRLDDKTATTIRKML